MIRGARGAGRDVHRLVVPKKRNRSYITDLEEKRTGTRPFFDGARRQNPFKKKLIAAGNPEPAVRVRFNAHFVRADGGFRNNKPRLLRCPAAAPWHGVLFKKARANRVINDPTQNEHKNPDGNHLWNRRRRPSPEGRFRFDTAHTFGFR